MPMFITFLGPITVVVAGMLLFASVKILRQYERAVVFTLGKFQSVKGPGLVLLVPFIQEMVRVDPRQPDRELGHQSLQCRNPHRRADRKHGPRHRQAGRG